MTVQSSAVCFWRMKKYWEQFILPLVIIYQWEGRVDVPIHLDGVVKKPTVYMDDQLLMKNGKLLVK